MRGPVEGSDGDTPTMAAPASEKPSALPSRLDRVGRYVTLRRLGAGGMGVVFLAYDPKLDRRVAVKLVHSRGRGFAVGAHSRLAREAQALARLSHPNVTPVFDVGESTGGLYIAMEFVEGTTLTDWLASTRRSWREIDRVFRQAARGLAAAHDVGLVHRDFKPDNVMVGNDGRVRVLDFGIAVVHQHADDDSIDTDDETTLTTRLTVTGAVMGTPAYMAPEQHCGQPPDARSDQFSFCVAFYEALCGERPFAGHSASELAASTHEGPPTPRAAAVPTPLMRAVLRGLATDPNDRWPSMAALLRAMAGRRIKRAPTAAAALALVGVAAGMISLDSGQSPAVACRDAAQEIDRSWAARSSAVEQAMMGSSLSYAGDAWTRVRAGLDDYAANWTALRQASCTVEQADDVLDARIACLDRAAVAFDATVGVLADRRAPVVEHAMAAVASLPALSSCSDEELLRSPIVPPGPIVTLAVGRARANVARARAREAAGVYGEGLAIARTAVDEARATDYTPVIAEALVVRGKLAMRTSDLDEARASLEQAAALAVEARHDDVALEAMTLLAGMLGYMEARPEAGLRWWRSANAIAERGADRQRHASLLNVKAGTLYAAEHLDAAAAVWAEALALLQGARSPGEHSARIAALNNLGTIHAVRGQWSAAEATLREALEAASTLHGPHHPIVATAKANLANALREAGDFDSALPMQREAYLDWERALGPDHPHVAAALSNLGMVARSAGRMQEALEHLETSVHIKRRALGPDHPDLALTLNNYGDVLRDAGQPERALEAHAEALQIWRRSDSAQDRLAYGLTNIGYDLVALDRAEDAMPPLEEALQITAHWELARTGVAEVQLGLATALAALDRAPQRAHRLALRARRTFDDAGGRYLEQRDRVDIWLAENGY